MDIYLEEKREREREREIEAAPTDDEKART